VIQLGRVPQPTQAQVHLFTMINGGLLPLDALLGVAVLRGPLAAGASLEHGPAGPPATPPLLKAAKPPQRPHCGHRLAATR
jgi:hypothetical protein